MNWKILHCFADQGIESEALTPYGTVYRIGLNPRDTNKSIPIKADATHPPLNENNTFDLGLFHPPCQPFSVATRNRETQENLIPIARMIAKKYCTHYIIENVPQAPLHNPVQLCGDYFGLPLHYERAFETNYHVEQPTRHLPVTDTGLFDKHHANGDWTGKTVLWKNVKGYNNEYSSRSLKREAVPRAYLEYLIRPLLT